MSVLDIVLRLGAVAAFLLLIPIVFATFVELVADRDEKSYRRYEFVLNPKTTTTRKGSAHRVASERPRRAA